MDENYFYLSPAEYILLMTGADDRKLPGFSRRGEIRREEYLQALQSLFSRQIITQKDGIFVPFGPKGQLFDGIHQTERAVYVLSADPCIPDMAAYDTKDGLVLIEDVSDQTEEEYRVISCRKEEFFGHLKDTGRLPEFPLEDEDKKELEKDLFEDIRSAFEGYFTDGSFDRDLKDGNILLSLAAAVPGNEEYTGRYVLLRRTAADLAVSSDAEGTNAEIATEGSVARMLDRCFGKDKK